VCYIKPNPKDRFGDSFIFLVLQILFKEISLIARQIINLYINTMRKTLLFMILAFFPHFLYTQTIHFEYDAAGNRESRTIILNQLKSEKDTTILSEAQLKEELAKIESQFNSEKLAEGTIKIFPNPTEGELRIKLENISNTEGINLQLYSPTGSLLQSKQIDSNYTEFDMLSYSPGIYILRISRLDEKLEYKIIKK
jgi:hypothetical protein